MESQNLPSKEWLETFVRKVVKETLEEYTKDHQVPTRLAISTSGGIFFVPKEKIIRLEAKENYTNLIIADSKNILASVQLGEFEDQLKGFPEFFRVHRSSIVNLAYVDVYIKSDGGYLSLKNGEQVDVSRRYRDELIRRLSTM